jgi:hypothetical protein
MRVGITPQKRTRRISFPSVGALHGPPPVRVFFQPAFNPVLNVLLNRGPLFVFEELFLGASQLLSEGHRCLLVPAFNMPEQTSLMELGSLMEFYRALVAV